MIYCHSKIARIFSNVKNRCTNPRDGWFKYYGGRGIKCLLTGKEIESLWIRDKAHEMKQPSLDRINPDGDYVFENCQFLEWPENRAKRRKFINSPANGNTTKTLVDTHGKKNRGSSGVWVAQIKL